MSDPYDADDQDNAETVDESMLDEDEEGGDMRTFEEMPDLLDVTQAQGDRDDDEAVAMNASEFDEDAIDPDSETEEDDELNYRAATEEREDDLDGLGDEDTFDEDALDMASSIEGLDEEIADADLATGGEDDVTDYQARDVSDQDLQDMGYSENRKGQILSKPDS